MLNVTIQNLHLLQSRQRRDKGTRIEGRGINELRLSQNKKAVLSQGNRAMPQLFFSV